MPGAAEHRMIGYPVLDAELTKPPIGQIDLHLRAQLPLGADRKHVSHNQHPDHQHRINRRPTCVRVIGHKLLVHPIQIENAVDLPDQMICRYHLVEVKRVEELALSAFSPPHHRPPPESHPDPRNHPSNAVSTRVLQHGVIPGSSQTTAQGISSPGTYEASLMWPLNDGEQQWNIMLDWTCR